MTTTSALLFEILLLLLLATSTISRAEEEVTDDEYNNEDPNACRLYMAASSIPNAGYGIFTARTLEKGDMILEKDGPSICVSDPKDFPGPHIELFQTVWWGISTMTQTMTFESELPRDHQIMFGSLPNFHPFLSNLESAPPEIEYDDRMANRSLDPGAGAFSYYPGKNSFANKRVQAWRELFLNYGENWLDKRSKDFDFVARSSDYLEAGRIISEMRQQLLEIVATEEENHSKEFIGKSGLCLNELCLILKKNGVGD
jgi:hypothetical protein